jgi:hypothetical protein
MADVVVTDTSVLPGAAATYGPGRNLIGETLTAGMAVYKKTTDANKLYKTDCNTATAPLTGKTYPPECEFAGFVLNGGAPGQSAALQTGGEISFGGTPLAQGEVYCLSFTPGKICPRSDLLAAQTPPHRLVVVGYAKTTAILVLKPIIAGVAL